MKRMTMGVVACGLLLAACGKDEPTNTQTTPKAFAEDVMTTEMKSSVPQYVIARVNNETGVIESVTTNEDMAAMDASTEAGKRALGAAEAKAFANGKAINVLESDDSMSESSSESFFYWGVRRGGFNVWRPYYNYGSNTGFRYGFYGNASFNNYNYYRYGLNSYCGNGAVYPFYYGYPAYNYYGYY